MQLARQLNEKYTYEDYQNWPDNERWEIIDGEVYNMSPAPVVKHQIIVNNINIALTLSKKNKCFTGIAPFDVVFDDENVVQPDVFVLCDKSKITEKNIQGAPDLVVEVTSPSTEKKDKKDKKALYEKYGVSEYLIIHPEAEFSEYLKLVDTKYLPEVIYNWDESLTLLDGTVIDFKAIFEKEK